MLTPDLLASLADTLVKLRAHEVPDTPWDRAGVIANLRKIDDTIPAHRIAYAAIKRAADPRCLTPAFDLDDSHWSRGIVCHKHPSAGMRTNGECAGCYVDRQPEPPAFKRTGVKPVPQPIAKQVRATLQPAVEPATDKRDVDREQLEEARGELAEARQHAEPNKRPDAGNAARETRAPAEPVGGLRG